ncbi:MAG: tetratricopeptide repeat protein [Planctomycetaceae bacterium]|nr:tetratricopeptide repeat protein [Planctomycetaceae bacterium]
MRVFALLLVGLVPQDLPTPEERADPVGAARQRIDQRETPGNMARAIDLLEWRKGQGPESVDVHLLLAEAYYRTVDSLDSSKAEDRRRMTPAREHGLQEARDALRLAPDRADGHYWLGCLLLQTADAEQSYSRLKEAIPELRRAQRLDPRVDEGGPARMLGRIYQETPGWPLLGSTTEAIRWYGRSLEAAPDNLQTHLWLGQTYAADRRVASARQELEKVVSAQAKPGHEKETQGLRREAETLLKTLPAR